MDPPPDLCAGLAASTNFAYLVVVRSKRCTGHAGFCRSMGACSIKRKRAVKLGGFTALPFRRRGRISIERWPEERAWGSRGRSDRNVLAHACRPAKNLAGPMGHERTGEAHH